ncbi:unnamed protein product [Trichobilharzia regenti]|nr:unnamed protein product [Trichobilharzia regenti]VDQ09850.1 unnamed protein product [Trichobilharzia regenti]
MEFFLKRVPAFSRALGDFDSDDDDNDTELTDDDNNTISVSFSNEKDEELNVTQVFKDYALISHIIMAIGPLTSAYLLLGLNLVHRNSRIIKVSYKKAFLIFTSYYLPDCHNTLVICIENEPKHLSYDYKHILCQYLDHLISPNAYNNNKQSIKTINVLCSRTVNHHYLSKSKLSTPFIRYIPSSSTMNTNHCTLKPLEQPNILTGLPAEALTWCYFNSIPPSSVYIVFYSPDVSLCEWSAVKEIFKCLASADIDILRKYASSSSNDWDKNLLSGSNNNKLIETCITAVCNSERAKTDQMYT